MIAGLEILNLHAQGGMAEVYRARGKGADGQTWHYAVKRILPELTSDAELRKMFVEEARVASMLVHPNIVRVYDLAKSEADELYIVMEFLEGRDLAEAIERMIDAGRAIPVWLAIHVAREVLQSLVYATMQAVDREGRALALIHRDISPHNIFMCFDGQVKLTDFGVAKVAQSSVLTQVGVTKGKFGYMSPEQLMSERLDFRSDLYNVGILLYETLTCRRLFFGDNASQFLQAMLRGEVPALDPVLRVPPELEDLMRRALSKQREERPENAYVFDQELLAIANRYGLLATREHVAAELRTLFGSEIESCPVPQQAVPSMKRPATAPKQLTSIHVAAPEVVRRVPSKIVPLIAQQGTNGLSDPAAIRPLPNAQPLSVPELQLQGAVQLPPAPPPLPPERQDDATPAVVGPDDLPESLRITSPEGMQVLTPEQVQAAQAARALARAQPRRPRTRSDVDDNSSSSNGRGVSGSGARPKPKAVTVTASAPRPGGTRTVQPLADDEPATIPPESAIDASTIPPESKRPAVKPPRNDTAAGNPHNKRPTIVVGGAGAKAIGLKIDSSPAVDDDWSEATSSEMPVEPPKGGIVTRSHKVVPLTPKKQR